MRRATRNRVGVSSTGYFTRDQGPEELAALSPENTAALFDLALNATTQSPLPFEDGYLLAAKREQIEAKAHWSAVTDDYLTKEFRKARDLAKAYDHIENPKARPTMHELRALGSWLYEQQGFPTEYVQALLGHATPEMTAYYQDGHEQKEVIYQHVQAGLKL